MTNISSNFKTISLIIPVFNNELSLNPLAEELLTLSKNLSDVGVKLELIFVDDGSTDNSYKVLCSFLEYFEKIKVLKLVRNFGAVNASRTGTRFVTGDAFSVLAADLQDPPDLVLSMTKEWLLGSKFVICERLTRKDPLMTRFFAKLHYFSLRTLVFPDYPKGGFDLALIDSSHLQTINESVKSGSVPLLAFSLGIKPKILSYDRPSRLHGKSSWTFFKKFNFFLDLMFGYSNKPLRFISFVGISVALLSFVYGTKVALNAILNQVAIPGFSAIASLLSFLTGLTLLMLGIIGEYLWRVYEEVNRRPAATIDTIIEK